MVIARGPDRGKSAPMSPPTGASGSADQYPANPRGVLTSTPSPLHLDTFQALMILYDRRRCL